MLDASHLIKSRPVLIADAELHLSRWAENLLDMNGIDYVDDLLDAGSYSRLRKLRNFGLARALEIHYALATSLGLPLGGSPKNWPFKPIDIRDAREVDRLWHGRDWWNIAGRSWKLVRIMRTDPSVMVALDSIVRLSTSDGQLKAREYIDAVMDRPKAGSYEAGVCAERARYAELLAVRNDHPDYLLDILDRVHAQLTADQTAFLNSRVIPAGWPEEEP